MSSKPNDHQETVGATPKDDEAEMAALYAEFAEEDRAWAEAGMSDYAVGLAREDATPRCIGEDL